jgi:hypothetical protein
MYVEGEWKGLVNDRENGAKLGGSEPRARARFQHTPTSEARCGACVHPQILCLLRHSSTSGGSVPWGGAGTNGAGMDGARRRGNGRLRGSGFSGIVCAGARAGFFFRSHELRHWAVRVRDFISMT